MLKDVKHLIWDVDGTFYRSNQDLARAIQHEIYVRVADRLGVPYEEAKDRFLAQYHLVGGATAALVELGLSRRLVQEAVDAVDKTRYLKPDLKLREMLEVALRDFTQIIVTNTSRSGTIRTLAALGLSPEIFREMVTADDVLHSKPDLEPFRKVLTITQDSAYRHVSIGDREKVDILPAKKLGMKTIFVWGISEAADASAPTVYDIPDVLNSCRL